MSNLSKNIFIKSQEDKKVAEYLKQLESLEFKSDKDSLMVCRVERQKLKLVG